MKTDLSELPKVKDVYITMLPGNDYREVAKKAVELKLQTKPWVKTSLAPGSQVVTDYLAK